MGFHMQVTADFVVKRLITFGTGKWPTVAESDMGCQTDWFGK